ncbi:hypothetical protein CL647_05520 [bacterium]|nr:hypothetical protein [bacterium]|tara:strand:- start:592 stop:930 length:339 start_codon:yes stop_codon:yes gene_type:complete
MFPQATARGGGLGELDDGYPVGGASGGLLGEGASGGLLGEGEGEGAGGDIGGAAGGDIGAEADVVSSKDLGVDLPPWVHEGASQQGFSLLINVMLFSPFIFLVKKMRYYLIY